MKMNKSTQFDTLLKISNDNESIILTSNMKVHIVWYDYDEDVKKSKNVTIDNILDDVINFSINDIYDAAPIKDILEISILEEK